MNYTRTGYTPKIEHKQINQILKNFEKRPRNKLADILIVGSTQTSKRRILEYQKANKIIIKVEDFCEYIKNNYPEYLL